MPALGDEGPTLSLARNGCRLRNKGVLPPDRNMHINIAISSSLKCPYLYIAPAFLSLHCAVAN